ncbi:MAG: hypothetical protein OXG13_03405 [Gemmatimonadaceae bacterium]|nr:hypothetical protein [Gemmatimonadaceae bacterium]
MPAGRWAGLLLFQLAAAGMWGPAEAVTIYRLGGEDYATFPLPPEVADGRAGFEQLSWTGVDPARAGVSDNVNLHGALVPFCHGRDENILAAAAERGGFLRTERYTGYGHDPDLDVVADGDFTTFVLRHIESVEYSPASGTHGLTMYFDLGGLFPVNRVRVSPRPGSSNYIEHIAIAAGSGEPHGGTPNRSHLEFHRKLVRETPFDFDLVAEITQNKSPVVEIPLDRTPVRQLALWVDPFQREPWEIAEVEVFAEGYVPFAGYTSNTIPLGAPSSLGRVRWSGRQDESARVSIRSRGGDDPDPSRYWRRTFRSDEEVPYGADGSPLTRAQYNKLEGKEKGRITHDAANWELWSAPYPFGDSLGVAMVAPRPRTFVQFSIDFASDFLDGGQVNYLEFAVSSPPAATDLVGEVDPWRAEASEPTEFTCAVRPTLSLQDRGFDSLELRFQGGRVEEVTGVEAAGAAVVFTEVDSLRTDDRVVVSFPRLGVNQSGELLQVKLRGEAYRYAATFQVRVFDSEAPEEVWQPVRAGDATDALDGNRLSVQTPALGASTVGGLQVEPAAFTPNGDGINDEAAIRYDLLKLTEDRRVQVRVWDLAGRLVRDLYEGRDRSGRYVQPWDGRDSSGRRVPPGLYLCRVVVDREGGRDGETRLIAVAY